MQTHSKRAFFYSTTAAAFPVLSRYLSPGRAGRPGRMDSGYFYPPLNFNKGRQKNPQEQMILSSLSSETKCGREWTLETGTKQRRDLFFSLGFTPVHQCGKFCHPGQDLILLSLVDTIISDLGSIQPYLGTCLILSFHELIYFLELQKADIWGLCMWHDDIVAIRLKIRRDFKNNIFLIIKNWRVKKYPLIFSGLREVGAEHFWVGTEQQCDVCVCSFWLRN